jgi:TolA-binding protein
MLTVRTMRHLPSILLPSTRLLTVLWFVLAAAWPACPTARGQETSLTNEERAKLDTFEGVTLDKADKVFAARDYPRALAEYDAFIVQFPESKVTPYAILRKGRSLQELQKRFEAIKVYQEVLDFFPDDVKYAAAAQFRIGQCHSENGDVEKAMKAWLALADDADYAKEPLGAAALNALADNLLKQGKGDEGIKRFEQVAINFRNSSPDAARGAIGRVVPYYIRTKPDAEKLRAFYVAAKTFEHGPRDAGEDVASDGLYWARVRDAINNPANSTFTDLQKDQRDAFYRYWAGKMQGPMPADDGFQIDLANYIRAYDRDDAAWAQRLDKQFADRQKDGDSGRVVRWIGAYAAKKEKVEEYYQKLDFAKMSNADIQNLVFTLLETNRDPERAKAAFAKLRPAEIQDDVKIGMLNWFRDRWPLPGSRDLALMACQSFTNTDAGRMHALRYLHWRCHPHHGHVRSEKDFPEGIALAADMQNVPAHAKESYSLGGNLLQWSGKYEDAIKAYQQADSPPQTLLWTSECLAKLGKLDPAVAQLREVENFFKDSAPDAALRAAYLYRDAGIKEKYVRSLRGVLKKYPKSGQSSEAHQRLEEMGLPIGGGVDADE